MTFPRFQLRTGEPDVSLEVQKRREAFAQGPLAKRVAAKEEDFAQYRDLLSPEIWGVEMFRLHGRAWPQMIALATGAAMQAERDAIAAADYVEVRG